MPMSRPSSALQVVSAGPLTTVQDLGRRGYASMGVGVSGAVDRSSHNRANRLVGNLPNAATLELTFGGFSAVATAHLWVAVTGANAEVLVDHIAHPIDTLLAVRPGQRIRIGMPSAGVRTYLSLRGGIDVPPILGSRSTDSLAQLGPDPVSDGDALAVGEEHAAFPCIDHIPTGKATATPTKIRLDFLPGPRDDWFTPAAQALLCSTTWTVNAASNRIGVRLDGPSLERALTQELLSEGVALGSVQVPPSGPIVFLNDHPVTGGYPVIGVVTRECLDNLAQARAGDDVIFRSQATGSRTQMTITED
ncbi:MAG: biotin-dependent carboxyltransferase family protein [Marmoricola sp.]